MGHFVMFVNEVSSVLDTTMGAIYEQTQLSLRPSEQDVHGSNPLTSPSIFLWSMCLWF